LFHAESFTKVYPNEAGLQVGGSARLVCVYDYQDAELVKWFFNNGPLPSNVKVLYVENLPQFILQIDHLSLLNFGTYKCEVIDSLNGFRYYDTAVLKVVSDDRSEYRLERHMEIRRELTGKFSACPCG